MTEALDKIPYESEPIYRREVDALPFYMDISPRQKAHLVDQARAGSQEAREAIIYSLLKMIVIYATRWRTVELDCGFLDLVSVGNLALVEYFDRALEKPNTYAYLIKCAKCWILEQSAHAGELIRLPRTPGVEPYEIISLHTGLDEDEFDLPEPTRAEEDYTPLYNALAAVPEQTTKRRPEREVITRFFGLDGHAPESISEIAGVSDSRENAYHATKKARNRALLQMQSYLMKHEREFVNKHSGRSGQYIAFTEHTPLE